MSKKLKLGLYLFGFSLLFYLLGPAHIVVLRFRNGDTAIPNYSFKYENFFHPRLKLLRQKYNLDEVIASGKSELEKIILLRHWVSQQWKSGSDFIYPPWDAVTILEMAQDKKNPNCGFCAQYAIVYCQALMSLGIPARYVDLPGHFVVEVFSNEYNKWILQDPSGDCHFEVNNIPLSGMEIHQKYWDNDFSEIEKVFWENGNFRRRKVVVGDLFVYRYYSIIRRNNHLSEPVNFYGENGRQKITDFNRNEWPRVGQQNINIVDDILAYQYDLAREFPIDRPLSSRREDFDYKLNQVIIKINKIEVKKGNIWLELAIVNPVNFSGYLAGVNGYKMRSSPGRIIWSLRLGLNRFKAMAQTSFGWQGYPAELLVFYWPGLI